MKIKLGQKSLYNELDHHVPLPRLLASVVMVRATMTIKPTIIICRCIFSEADGTTGTSIMYFREFYSVFNSCNRHTFNQVSTFTN